MSEMKDHIKREYNDELTNAAVNFHHCEYFRDKICQITNKIHAYYKTEKEETARLKRLETKLIIEDLQSEITQANDEHQEKIDNIFCNYIKLLEN